MPPPPKRPGHDASELAPEIASATADPSRRIGRYVVLSELGRGGMGVVLRCWDPSLRRLVAVKLVLDPDHAGPEQLKRFQREGRVMAQLSHPGIVQLLDVGDHRGQPFIALEFVDGHTFEDAYRQRRPSAQELARVLAQVADALQHAHDHGLVHRDVKPGNVFIDQGGNARLGDFGLVAVSESTTRLTRTGRTVGTPSYMAPEQLSNDLGEVGPRADIYGLGCLLYWGLTGRDPFHGDSVVEVLRQVLMSEVRPPRELEPDTHPDMNRITLRCLAKKPEHRPASAASVAKDLRQVMRGETLSRHAHRKRRLPRWTAVVATLALVASVVGLAQWFDASPGAPLLTDSRQRRRPRDPGPQGEAALPTPRPQQADAPRAPAPSSDQVEETTAAALIRRGLEKLSPRESKLQRWDILSAIDDFSHAIEMAPQLADAWQARGKAHMADGNSRAALADFSHVIELDPTRVEAWLQRGKARAAQLLSKLAIADYSHAIKLDPTNLDAWDARARLRLLTGEVEGAEQDFQRYRTLSRQVRKTFRDSAAGHVLLGDRLQLSRKYAGAVAEYERALAIEPSYALDKSHALAWAFLGNQLQALGDIHRAIANLTRAVEIAPDLEDAWALLGNLRLGVGDTGRAIFSHSRAIEIDPTDAVNWANRGNVHHARNDHARAIEDFSQSLALDASDAGVWYSRGMTHGATRNHARAIEDFSQSLALDASNAGVWYRRGLAHGMVGDPPSAIEDFSRALALEPGSAVTWYNRGAARISTGDFDGAIDDFSRAINLNPRDPDFWARRGLARHTTGDLDGTISDFERCLKLAPQHADAPRLREALDEARLQRSRVNDSPGN